MAEFQSLATFLQQKYADQHILILGFGREGKSTFETLSKIIPPENLAIMDENAQDLPSKVPYDLSQLAAYDVIFKTPVISRYLPELQAFLRTGGKITSQTNELLACFGHQVIGVTGTKGKSTTSSLIYHLLKTAGKDVVLVGNIGKPAFDFVAEVQPQTLIVAELSSYQLEKVEFSPHWAVWLNIFPEHLNYHGSLEQYVFAKAQITLHQTREDYFLYNQAIPLIQTILDQTLAQTQAFSDQDSILQLIELHIAGYKHLPKTVQEHNVLPAVLLAKELGLSADQICEGLKSFSSLPHRLEKVGYYRGITFIDDTLATIPQAAIAGLEATPETKVLLLGGFDRGIEFEPIVDAIVQRKIPYIIFFPESGQKMIEILRKKYTKDQWPEYVLIDDMEEAVKLAYEWLPDGGTVLLSPASPSFGHFKDYEDKAAQYVKAIEKFGKATSNS